MKRVLCCLVSLAILVGCGGTEKIARDVVAVKNLATSSKQKFTDIESEAHSESPDLKFIQATASAGVKEQDEINAKADSVVRTLPEVKDVVPWWATLLNHLFLVGGLIGLLLLLILTPLGRGLSSLVGNAFALVASFLPTPSTKKGILLAKMDDPNDPMTKEAAVAAIRSTDPVIDQAYQRTRKKLKACSKPSVSSSGAASAVTSSDPSSLSPSSSSG